MKKINFASDNYAGIHPDILQAITFANRSDVPAYGNDDYTAMAVKTFKEHLGENIEVFFVFNGTGANVTSLIATNASYHAIICAETAHIQNDECGAPEKFTGSKLLLVPSDNGKLTIDKIEKHLLRIGDQHATQPKVISISQSTEYGTVYTVKEITDIADFAHQRQLFLHVDGARIANALVSLNLDLSALTDMGIDVLSFGGTKNGMMLGEAVIFFNRKLAEDFLFVRKQSMQLASKMRFISTQFHTLLSTGLWKSNAARANRMATLLANKLSAISKINITQSVDANAIFAIMPKPLIEKLQERFYFYVWNALTHEVRLMTSFDTTDSHVNEFVDAIHKEYPP